MTEPAYDLIIRGGRVATTTDTFDADVAIAGALHSVEAAVHLGDLLFGKARPLEMAIDI